MSETTIPDIHEDLVSAALVICQGSLKTAHMDATNPFFKSKYATLGAIIEASREPLFNAGLAVQQVATIADGIVSVHTIVRHKSGQTLDGGTMSLPLGESDRNSDAQLAGSLLTYMKRYAWASVLGIYADSDDDGNSAPKGAVARPAQKPPYQATPTAKTPPAPVSEAPKADSEPVVGPKYRLQTLNKLQADPGGRWRAIVHQFLTVKGYINATQEPEDWALDKLPKSAVEFVALGEQIHQFERQMREQPEVAS
jgi:hypothetical protein